MKKYEMDLTNGPIFSKIVLFSVPLMLTEILQLLYNAVNIVVVGQFVGKEALAAVGSTSSLINLITNLFIGLSVGGGVTMARHFGADRQKDAGETVHTSVAVSVVSGIIVMLIGVFMAKTLLTMMDTPADVLNNASRYLRIYFLGMPAMMVYNYSAAILRAVGDTKRPLYFLSFSGVVNVTLNLTFVLLFHMEVAGVACATVISQYLSAILVIRCLVHSEGCVRLELRKIRFYKDKLIEILKIGLPAGVQGTIFSASNVLVQSSVNSFGSSVMAGNAAAMNIEGFVYVSMNAVYQAALTFIGQNVGAGKLKRIGRILGECLLFVTVVGISVGGIAYLFSGNLLGIYTSDPGVIPIGVTRMSYICALYFLCGMMDVLAGSLRGMGYSMMPLIVSIIGVCGVRITWIYTVFAANHTLPTLYISYPISWSATAAVHLVFFFILKRKLVRSAVLTAQNG